MLSNISKFLVKIQCHERYKIYYSFTKISCLSKQTVYNLSSTYMQSKISSITKNCHTSLTVIDFSCITLFSTIQFCDKMHKNFRCFGELSNPECARVRTFTTVSPLLSEQSLILWCHVSKCPCFLIKLSQVILKLNTRSTYCLCLTEMASKWKKNGE